MATYVKPDINALTEII